MVEDQIAELAARWKFEWTEEIPGGHCSRVFASVDRVLKIPFQGEELTTGCLALQKLGALGPEIYEVDQTCGAVLMERLRPGTPLSKSNLSDEANQKIIADFIMQIQQMDTSGAMALSDYYTSQHSMLDFMLSTSPTPVFLHGDLHHENVLWSERHGWKVIDPKGLVGDPNFEAIAFLRNPIEQLIGAEPLASKTFRRLEEFALLLGLDPLRMSCWCYIDLKFDAATRPLDHPWSVLQETLRQELRPLGVFPNDWFA